MHLTIPQAAAQLGTQRENLYKLQRRGRIKTEKRNGRLVLITPLDELTSIVRSAAPPPLDGVEPIPAAEVAKRLGVTTKTIGRWCRSGQLKHLNQGGWYHVYVTSDEIEAIRLERSKPKPKRHPKPKAEKRSKPRPKRRQIPRIKKEATRKPQPPPKPKPQALSVRKAAKSLGCCPRTIVRLIETSVITAERKANRWHIQQSLVDVQKALEAVRAKRKKKLGPSRRIAPTRACKLEIEALPRKRPKVGMSINEASRATGLGKSIITCLIVNEQLKATRFETQWSIRDSPNEIRRIYREWKARRVPVVSKSRRAEAKKHKAILELATLPVTSLKESELTKLDSWVAEQRAEVQATWSARDEALRRCDAKLHTRRLCQTSGKVHDGRVFFEELEPAMLNLREVLRFSGGMLNESELCAKKF
ncbi:MAG TPA: hypothetical protein DDW52_02105 [Planctomycetaceae bacterium]|nr:hypothetical protein [Planctomycetaceae bacterium]